MDTNESIEEIIIKAENDNQPKSAPVPFKIALDVVHPSNGWSIILLNEGSTKKYIIKKNEFYYELHTTSYFKNCPFTEKFIQALPDLRVNLGYFKPLINDQSYLNELPIEIQGNLFIMNNRTNIIYIKPNNIVLGIQKRLKFDQGILQNCLFGGMFHNFLHSENHTNQPFLNVMQIKKPKPNNPNVFGKQYVNKLEYDKQLSNKSLLEDKILNNNPYTIMKKPQVFQVPQPEETKKIQKITILIPYLNKHTNNKEQLERTISSILKFMNNSIFAIYVITNKDTYEFDNELMSRVKVVLYKNYVGSLGIENRLNVSMKNKCDIATFYNFIIQNYVVSDTFIIWEYNWELYGNWNVLESNLAIPIYNHYKYGDKEYKSRNSTYGLLLDQTKRYVNTRDLTNVYVPVKKTLTNILVPVKNVYTLEDYEDIRNRITFETNREVKDFYRNIMEGRVPEYILND
jgi:hypothetical protein